MMCSTTAAGIGHTRLAAQAVGLGVAGTGMGLDGWRRDTPGLLKAPAVTAAGSHAGLGLREDQGSYAPSSALRFICLWQCCTSAVQRPWPVNRKAMDGASDPQSLCSPSHACEPVWCLQTSSAALRVPAPFIGPHACVCNAQHHSLRIQEHPPDARCHG